MISQAGPVIFFLLTFVATVIVGLYLVNYGAHCFMVVLDESAAGIDEVKWPDEPIIDWLWKCIFLTWLLFVGLVPVWVIAVLAFPAAVAGPLGIIPLTLGVLWLLFPICLLSALSAKKMFVVLHPEVLRRLARRPHSLALFYLLTGILIAGSGWLSYLGATRNPAIWLLAAPLGSAVLLIYARLLGRLAYLLAFRTPIGDKRKPRRGRVPGGTAELRGGAEPRGTAEPRADSVQAPWAIPVAAADPALREAIRAAEPVPAELALEVVEVSDERAEEDEWTAHKTPYALASDTETAQPARTQQPLPPVPPGADDDEWSPNKKPYALVSEEPPPLFRAPSPPPLPSERAGSARGRPETPPAFVEADLPPLAHSPYQAPRIDDRIQSLRREPEHAIRPVRDDRREAPEPRETPERREGPVGAADALPELPQPDAIELAWLEDRKPPPPIRWPFILGVWHFPWYPNCLRSWVYLSIVSLAFGFLLNTLLATWPDL